MKSFRHFLAAGLLILSGNLAMAQQRVDIKPSETPLNPAARCDASTQAWILSQQASKSTSEIRLLAKVNPGFNPKTLVAQGVKVGSRAGNVITLRVPADKIGIIERCSGILQYTLSREVAPFCNQNRYDTRTDSVHSGAGGLPQPFTGEGVLIGITDWGFDFKHPNYNNNGEDNRRLLRVWDQYKLSGPAPEGFDYGTEIATRHDLLQARCDTVNIYGHHTHGTHVAGIAAGRGIDGNYTGQAPYANLLFSAFLLDEASWIDAVNWMKDVARQEQKRLVINSSWGMYTFGTLDGTSLLSQAINSLADSNVVFVTSAGNNGDVNFHISQTFNAQPDTLKTVAHNAKTYDGQAGNALILWGEPRESFRATIRLVSADTVYTFPWYNTADGDRYIDSVITINGASVPFNITIERSNPFNHRSHILFNVNTTSNLSGCSLELWITSLNTTVHAWNLCNLENHAGNMGLAFNTNGLEGFTPGNPAYGVSEPAVAEGTITVAAHHADALHLITGEDILGTYADFTSRGPVIDGRRKPDISAPGYNVVSSLNSNCDPEHRVNAAFVFNHGGTTYEWGRLSGTSMSAPAVTGIVALMLQANPTISPRHIRDIICSTARNDIYTGELVARDSISDIWGWGKIDALRAVNEALAHVDIPDLDSNWLQHSLQVYPNPATSHIFVTTGQHDTQLVQIYSINGSLIHQQPVTMEATIDITSWPKGIYIVRCGSRTAKLVK